MAAQITWFVDDRLPLTPGKVPAECLIRFRTLVGLPAWPAAIGQAGAALDELIAELRVSRQTERQGRLIDSDQAGSDGKKRKIFHGLRDAGRSGVSDAAVPGLGRGLPIFRTTS